MFFTCTDDAACDADDNDNECGGGDDRIDGADIDEDDGDAADEHLQHVKSYNLLSTSVPLTY